MVVLCKVARFLENAGGFTDAHIHVSAHLYTVSRRDTLRDTSCRSFARQSRGPIKPNDSGLDLIPAVAERPYRGVLIGIAAFQVTIYPTAGTCDTRVWGSFYDSRGAGFALGGACSGVLYETGTTARVALVGWLVRKPTFIRNCPRIKCVVGVQA